MLLLNFSKHPINLETLPEDVKLLTIPATAEYDELVEHIEHCDGVLVDYSMDELAAKARLLSLRRDKTVLYVGV